MSENVDWEKQMKTCQLGASFLTEYGIQKSGVIGVVNLIFLVLSSLDKCMSENVDWKKKMKTCQLGASLLTEGGLVGSVNLTFLIDICAEGFCAMD